MPNYSVQYRVLTYRGREEELNAYLYSSTTVKQTQLEDYGRISIYLVTESNESQERADYLANYQRSCLVSGGFASILL